MKVLPTDCLSYSLTKGRLDRSPSKETHSSLEKLLDNFTKPSPELLQTDYLLSIEGQGLKYSGYSESLMLLPPEQYIKNLSSKVKVFQPKRPSVI